MAETESEETEQGGKQGGGGLKVAILVVASLLIGAAGSFAVVTLTAGGAEESEELPEADTASAPESSDAPLEERIVRLDPFVVNLGGTGPARYLKATLALELASAEDVALVEGRVPKIRDAVIVLLSSRRLVDMQEFEGKVLIKEDLLDHVNGVLEQPSVQSVLFTEFVVQ